MYVYPTRPVLLHSAFTLASSTPLLSFLALHLFPLLCSTSYSLLPLSLSLSLCLFCSFVLPRAPSTISSTTAWKGRNLPTPSFLALFPLSVAQLLHSFSPRLSTLFACFPFSFYRFLSPPLPRHLFAPLPSRQRARVSVTWTPYLPFFVLFFHRLVCYSFVY